MDLGTAANPIVSKLFCSSSRVTLIVRKRPRVVNGGGLVVTDSGQNVLFRVDGCGTIGVKGELILRDGDGAALLLIRRKGGIVQALSFNRQWRGYLIDYQGAEKPVFSMKEPTSFFASNGSIKVSVEPKIHSSGWDFEIRGSFPGRACSIRNRNGKIVAEVGVKKEVDELMVSKDLYHVVVQPGFDQAFVFGVIAVLEDIYGESLWC